MLASLKLKKSAGVPVTFEVHRLLVEANAARDSGSWSAAASAYGTALKRDPSLYHIWVQYGHALKEAGDYTEAQTAYESAAKMRPTSAEPLLHIGHLYKDQGNRPAANRTYIQAAKRDPHHPDVLVELRRYVSEVGCDSDQRDILALFQEIENDGRNAEAPMVDTLEETRSAMRKLAAAFRREGLADRAAAIETLIAGNSLLADVTESEEEGAVRVPTNSPPLVFDVSDLISYFRNARLPTGIQRVQIETITAMLASRRASSVKICAFAENRDSWVEIPSAIFLNLARASLADGDRTAPDWQTAITKLHLAMDIQESLVFPDGANLINLGTSWWLQNYFLFVRQAKVQHSIKYIPFVHDLIPVKAAEHCTNELTRDFISWIIGAFEHADFFLVNSEATKRDLISVAQELGHTLAPDHVSVIRLDADFRKPELAKLEPSALAKWGLSRTPFVLFVSTIESRKNHLGAFDAWIELLRRHGPRQMPRLVCVGNRGWLNDAVYSRLEGHDGLKDHVVMLSGLSDAELALLYRSCLFTFYPSRYEGWGLPVTESLCYGKTALLSDSSSLPEAGGEFAAYFESGSTVQIVEALEKLIFDASYRTGLECRIKDAFRPRTWAEIGNDMAQSTSDWASLRDTVAESKPAVALAKAAAYHPIVRNFETRIWKGMRSAEIFRAGSGWWGPDDWGCWTKAQGAMLKIGLPEGTGPWRLYLRIHGLPKKSCRFHIELEGVENAQEGVLQAQAFKWLTFDVASQAGDLCLRIQGADIEDLATVTNGSDPRVVSLGVCGFYLCAEHDLASRNRFLEAVVLGNIDHLAFNKEPPTSSLYSASYAGLV